MAMEQVRSTPFTAAQTQLLQGVFSQFEQMIQTNLVIMEAMNRLLISKGLITEAEIQDSVKTEMENFRQRMEEAMAEAAASEEVEGEVVPEPQDLPEEVV